MKRKYITLTILVSLIILSCKDEVKVETVDINKDTLKTNDVDRVAIKQKIAAEKEKFAKPYNELEDAQAKINELISHAKQEGKNVFIQVGGNWCIWCLRFNDFVQKNDEIKAVVDANYLYYHLNYSPKNFNEAIFSKYSIEPKKLGFPFFFVLNDKGELINTIGSENLEANSSYDISKVKQMFLEYAPKK